MTVASATGRPASMSAAISPSSGKVSLVDLLDEDVEDAAAGQPDRERVVVGDAVPLEHRLAGRDDRLGQLVDRALDAAAGDRADRGLVGADQHRGAGRARRGLEGRDHGADADGLAGLPPLHQLGQHLTHGTTTSISSAKVASEWPATKSSTYGSAATTPCCTGS